MVSTILKLNIDKVKLIDKFIIYKNKLNSEIGEETITN